MKILLIDDNIMFREILNQSLLDVGFEVFNASNGREGLNILESEKINIVLTDIQMPLMTGFDFLIAARKKYGVKLPIFVMTGGSRHSSKDIMDACATGYFEKPFSILKTVKLLANTAKALSSSSP